MASRDESPYNRHTLYNQREFLSRLSAHVRSEAGFSAGQANHMVNEIRAAFKVPGLKRPIPGYRVTPERLGPGENIGQQRSLFKQAGYFGSAGTTKKEAQGITRALTRFDQLATQRAQRKRRAAAPRRLKYM